MLKYKYSSIPDEWDYVLFDCPPALGLVTRAALAAVQHIFVPVETHYMALSGLADLIETYDWVKEVMNPQISIYGILPCRVNLRTRNAQEVINELRSNFGELVFNTLIRENVRIAESPSHHKPITAYDDRSYGAEDYRAAAKEFVSRHKKMSEVKSNAK
jgi:chromosome partitioning protein